MKWTDEAMAHLGTAEIPGPKHNTKIQGWLKTLGAWWTDDETPWCGVFVAHCMQVAGISRPKHWYRAKGWLDWGVTLKAPIPGCVCILEREGGGHVFIVLGRTAVGDLVGIGGNQGNKVSIASFQASRAIGYRWPSGVPVTSDPMPTLKANGSPSEA